VGVHERNPLRSWAAVKAWQTHTAASIRSRWKAHAAQEIGETRVRVQRIEVRIDLNGLNLTHVQLTRLRQPFKGSIFVPQSAINSRQSIWVWVLPGHRPPQIDLQLGLVKALPSRIPHGLANFVSSGLQPAPVRRIKTEREGLFPLVNGFLIIPLHLVGI